jgi:hypothetical protein
LGHEIPELVPGIGHGQRLGAFGYLIASEDLHALGARQRIGIEPETPRQLHIQLDQTGRRYGRRVHPGEEVLGQSRVSVFEAEVYSARIALGANGRHDFGSIR